MGRGHMQFVGGEWVDGMLVGKAANMAESAWRKEKREFAVLCNALYWRKWRVLHPEQAREYRRRWNQTEAGKASMQTRRQKYRDAHREKFKASQRASAARWYAANRERHKANVAKRYRESRSAP